MLINVEICDLVKKIKLPNFSKETPSNDKPTDHSFFSLGRSSTFLRM